nr:FlgD immunoglobulin-like domain containing protein [uncultured Desulfuromonas sp.]
MIKRVIFVLFLLLLPQLSAASDTSCARVSIEILQELTLERVAFDAKMVIHNNLPDRDLDNVRVDVSIQDVQGNLRNDLFFVKVSSLDNIAGVDGDGTVSRNSSAEIHWLIIPSPGAGGDLATGVLYLVGATLTYSIDGDEEILPINPDQITVRPTAQLYLDYFTPYSVLGDNPFTSQVEAPTPFPLAVRVLNDGYGPANALKIDSAQPKIVDNQQGLLIDFKLLGAAVNDSAVSPSLIVDMGDVGSKEAATGYWEMISTLSGRFVGFDVSFTHDSELGGELTSLIKETNAHYLTHRIRVNLPGRDGLLDFLADTDGDNAHLPDNIFESEIPSGGSDRHDAVVPVTVVSPTVLPNRPTPQAREVTTTLDVSSHAGGWIYTHLSDPSQGLLILEGVVRSDGVQLDPHNFWIEENLDANYNTIFTLQFVDYRASAAAPGKYTLIFSQPEDDLIPPVTTLVYDGPAVEKDQVYLTPETRIVLTAQDNEAGSGVEQMFRRVGDESFVPAVPFTLAEGTHALDYYSLDRAGNVESTQSKIVVVDNEAPAVTEPLSADPEIFAPQAPGSTAFKQSTTLRCVANDTVPEVTARLEIMDASGNVVRSFEKNIVAGAVMDFVWEGDDAAGNPVASGDYTALISIDDGLDHVTQEQVTVTVAEWFAVTAVDPVPGAIQCYPAMSGTRVVWQDNRYGQNDIYLKDLSALSAPSVRITDDVNNQEHPDIDGDFVVWQDDRDGDSNIYGYDLQEDVEFVICEATGNQVSPVVSGDWVAWQDNRNGHWDIYAWNRSTEEERQITSHERDQIRPAISSGLLVWEDYRHGLAEIYRYDLVNGIETRQTLDGANQFLPDVYGDVLVWTDQRDGQQEIYRSNGADARRLTYGSGNRSQASLADNLLVYTDYSAGISDPNLGFMDILSGVGSVLTTHPSRQEEPAAGENMVTWQDDRDGTLQIYMAELTLEDHPVTEHLQPGFNLIAIGQLLVDSYANASELFSSSRFGNKINRVLTYSSLHGQFFEADSGTGNFALVKGSTLVVYATSEFDLPVAGATESMTYSLPVGVNYVGLFNVPVGYRAYDLIASLGMENIVSVRSYDQQNGRWLTAAVREKNDVSQCVGNNFSISSGDALVLTMAQRVDGWSP